MKKKVYICIFVLLLILSPFLVYYKSFLTYHHNPKQFDMQIKIERDECLIDNNNYIYFDSKDNEISIHLSFQKKCDFNNKIMIYFVLPTPQKSKFQLNNLKIESEDGDSVFLSSDMLEENNILVSTFEFEDLNYYGYYRINNEFCKNCSNHLEFIFDSQKFEADESSFGVLNYPEFKEKHIKPGDERGTASKEYDFKLMDFVFWFQPKDRWMIIFIDTIYLIFVGIIGGFVTLLTIGSLTNKKSKK